MKTRHLFDLCQAFDLGDAPTSWEFP